MSKPRIGFEEIASLPTVAGAAAEYWRHGVSVIPTLGKRPAPELRSWQKYQDRRPTAYEMTRWQSIWNWGAGVGIICGAVSGNLVVMDFDGWEGEVRFLEKFPQYHAVTYSVASGSGKGAHYYFYTDKLPPTTRVTDIYRDGREAVNIELRANGCYVVAPPSIHDTGKPYEVHHQLPILRVPNFDDVVEWIKDLIKRKHGGHMPPAANSAASVGSVDRWAAAALANESRNVQLAHVGQRNTALWRAALKLGSLVGAGSLARAQVERELLTASAALVAEDGERAVMKIIAWGIDNGSKNPRGKQT